MTKRFAAAVLRSYESRFTVEEVTLGARPADGEILVRIAGCGMCRTDLAVRRSAGRSPLPAVLGHEGAGVVVETGGPDTGLGVGDHVVLSFDSCGHCRSCLGAAPAYCDSFASLNLFGGVGECGTVHRRGRDRFGSPAIFSRRTSEPRYWRIPGAWPPGRISPSYASGSRSAHARGWRKADASVSCR
ncbi:L-threonine 3-dehydrogenase [Streptomyces antimycoticus]